MQPIRLLVVGEFAYSSGSSNVIREYVRHARRVNIDLRISSDYGRSDAQVAMELPHCPDLSWATHMLVIYEGRPILDAEAIERIDRIIPRQRRVVFDADGHRAPLVSVDHDDNAWPCGQPCWQNSLEKAGSVILQPSIGLARSGTTPFPFFGVPSVSTERVSRHRCEPLHMQYVGNNWFRYQAVIEVFSAMREVRTEGKLRLRGKGWDGSVVPSLEHGTFADVDELRRLNIEVSSPVPFGRVVDYMGEGLLTPVLVRPVLSELKLLTPRMLETLAATTIPVYRKEDGYIQDLYGDNGDFCLGAAPTEKLRLILDDLPYWQWRARELREELRLEFGYEQTVAQLRRILESL